jgi:hypothetical protein
MVLVMVRILMSKSGFEDEVLIKLIDDNRTTQPEVVLIVHKLSYSTCTTRM